MEEGRLKKAKEEGSPTSKLSVTLISLGRDHLCHIEARRRASSLRRRSLRRVATNENRWLCSSQSEFEA